MIKIKRKLINIIGYSVASCIFSYFLYLCMLVPDYHHYVILMHPMNKIACNKFVTAKVDFQFSNYGKRGSEGESYSFSFSDKPNNPDIFPPRFTKPSDCFYIIGSSFSNEMEKSMLMSFFPIDSIKGMFYVMHTRTSNNEDSKFHHSISIKGKTGSKIAILEKEFPSTQQLNGIEDVLFEAIEKGKNSDKFLFHEKVFDYDNSLLHTSSFSIIAEEMTSENDYSIKRQKKESLFSPITKLFTPYDITKAGYKIYVFSESIDSVLLTLNFDENVELSSINKQYRKNNSKSITFHDIATKQLDEPRNQFLTEMNYKYGQVNIRRFQKCAYRDCFSFWVKYESSETLQWIRLFILTSILGYLLTNLFSQIVSMPENIYLNFKNKKK